MIKGSQDIEGADAQLILPQRRNRDEQQRTNTSTRSDTTTIGRGKSQSDLRDVESSDELV